MFTPVPFSFLFSAEAVFAYTAERAYPVFRYIFPCCSRSYSVIRIAYCRVIYVTAYIAYIFIHVLFLLCSIERISCASCLFNITINRIIMLPFFTDSLITAGGIYCSLII